jgi:predicted nucleic acid-binding protein
VNIFFDTTVLVAASAQSHPHFSRARPAFLRVAAGKDKGFMSAHSIAEVYAALTRLPVHPRIHPTEAARIVVENILPCFDVVPITKRDYLAVLKSMGDEGFPGAKIYDALLLRCASNCEPDWVYTFNLADFRQLASPLLQHRICAP